MHYKRRVVEEVDLLISSLNIVSKKEDIAELATSKSVSCHVSNQSKEKLKQIENLKHAY